MSEQHEPNEKIMSKEQQEPTRGTRATIDGVTHQVQRFRDGMVYGVSFSAGCDPRDTFMGFWKMTLNDWRDQTRNAEMSHVTA